MRTRNQENYEALSQEASYILTDYHNAKDIKDFRRTHELLDDYMHCLSDCKSFDSELFAAEYSKPAQKILQRWEKNKEINDKQNTPNPTEMIGYRVFGECDWDSANEQVYMVYYENLYKSENDDVFYEECYTRKSLRTFEDKVSEWNDQPLKHDMRVIDAENLFSVFAFGDYAEQFTPVNGYDYLSEIFDTTQEVYDYYESNHIYGERGLTFSQYLVTLPKSEYISIAAENGILTPEDVSSQEWHDFTAWLNGCNQISGDYNDFCFYRELAQENNEELPPKEPESEKIPFETPADEATIKGEGIIDKTKAIKQNRDDALIQKIKEREDMQKREDR